MIKEIKFYYIIFFLFIFNNLYSYEIIRDPVFEEYFVDISYELNTDDVDVYLIKSEIANAFVIKNSIYFTTGLLNVIENEDTLKAIYLHEYGHLIKNHFQAKQFKTQQSINKKLFLNLFSIGLAVVAGNTDIGLGASITLNTNLVNELSKHSINFEIEADNYMANEIRKNKINVDELKLFLNKISNNTNYYFVTHPRSIDRINNLNEFNFKKSKNSDKFNWIKSKYSKNSNISTYNNFFINLEKGIYDHDKKIDKINKYLIQYEAFKRGFFIEDWHVNFEKMLQINTNSFLKIEYINYILDNNIFNKFYIIEKLKFNEDIMEEFFYYFMYGKYYNKVGNFSLSYFYFCQFYKSINSAKKANFYCEKYDIKDIPTLDKTYALFK